MSSGNGEPQFPIEVLDAWRHAPPGEPIYVPMPGPTARTRRSLFTAIALFAVTVFSTLAVGAQFAADYALDRTLGFDGLFDPYIRIFRHPSVLLAGIPFSFTLLGILLAHELGHFFACRYYGIAATYPYFIPAPTLIGTLGAFIRIRAPIINRKALFDVGLAGPVVGFLFALPALAVAILYSKVVPGAQANSPVIFGNPLLMHLLTAWLRPGVRAADILLHPVGRAAWVGLFATALNLLPAGQLDGGHILYAITSRRHRLASLVTAVLLLPLGRLWWGWWFWVGVLLAFGFRHAPLVDPWTPIDTKRRVWAVIAVVIFLLCFMPIPFTLTE
jgi:membrane-associated protease RseP (regulator of RpoE activity)